MILPDTSVWVEYLRRGEKGRAAQVGELVSRHELVTCGPVAAELLVGTSRQDRQRVAHVLQGLAWVELRRAEWLRVGELGAELRAHGKTVPLTDVEIAVAALRVQASVWTGDSDFERIAEVVGDLELRTFA